MQQCVRVYVYVVFCCRYKLAHADRYGNCFGSIFNMRKSSKFVKKYLKTTLLLKACYTY